MSDFSFSFFSSDFSLEFFGLLLLDLKKIFFLPHPTVLWDPSSPKRDWTYIPCIRRQSLNHWLTKKVPNYLL